MRFALLCCIWGLMFCLTGSHQASADWLLVRSIASGKWSDPSNWEGMKVPIAGDRVLIRSGHLVTFDARIEAPIRSLHIAGTLSFDPDRDVLLTVGLIKVQSGEDASETGFETHSSMTSREDFDGRRASLLVGTAAHPIGAEHTSMIRLAMVEGLDPEECPAIVCLGGRMEFHGAEVSPTWVKLGNTSSVGDSTVTLAEPVAGWKVGDRVIVTSTRHQYSRNETRTPRVRQAPQTEERLIKSVDGPRLTLDSPLINAHSGEGDYRGEVALLSRNVVVESAKPDGVRGHTMYHRGSLGAISFAEFRHLGKEGKLGKYSLHFHRVGDSMRGASIVGASIWDSGNRWITIHGTNRLVVRDCVGYRSIGHGFFLEDGTEVDNIFDHNLAVRAEQGSSLTGQVLPYDENEGAGFWWANSRNAFIRNVAVECDAYGYRLEAPTSDDYNPVMQVRGADGRTSPVDIRTQPFLRFDSNEAHSQRRYGVKLGGAAGNGDSRDTDTVGPDSQHPLAIHNLRIWDCHWAFTPATSGLLADDLVLARSEYGFYKPKFDRQAYRGLLIRQCGKAYADLKGQPPEPSAFPKPLDPIDDRPPVSVITDTQRLGSARTRVSGVSVDDGRITKVRVNGQEARALVADFSRWEAILESIPDGPLTLSASALDSAGNLERTPHVLTISNLTIGPKPTISNPNPAN